MKRKVLIRSLALMACLLCSLSAMATDEAYACYTSSNTTLSFYYDNMRSSRPGTTYDLPTGSSIPWYQDHTYGSVTRVVFASSFAEARPTSTRSWFNNMSNLQSVTGMEYLNTSMVTNMGYMFYYCNRLTSLDLSHFNTAKVTDMAYMFYKCSGLTSLDLSSFNTAQVSNMTYMFNECSGLTNLNLSSFNTSKVTNMRSMFFGCTGLTSLDLGSFNTAKVTNMGWMFDGCRQLTSIYVSSAWNTAATTTSSYMFYDCTSLVGDHGTTYDANHVDKAYAHIDGGPSNPGYLSEKQKEAYACYTSSNTTLTFYYDNLRRTRTDKTYNLNYSLNSPEWYTDSTYLSVTRVVFDSTFANARPTSTCYWFDNMKNLESESIEGLNYLNTSEVTIMEGMFKDCSSLTELDLRSFNTANVTHMSWMFYGCSSLTELDLSSFNTAKVKDMDGMFQNCRSLTSLDLSSFNTANVTYMSFMFFGCSSLTSLDLSHFNTANVILMSWMFTGCSALTSLNLNGFNTSNVTHMHNMFKDCSSLTSLDLSGFNNEKTINMCSMFEGCSSLKSINLENFNTSNVMWFEGMFRNCSSLIELDLRSFNTANVVKMQQMFEGCSSLTSLNLGSFNTEKVYHMGAMLRDCSNLVTVYVGSEWTTESVTEGGFMFMNCINLVGGQGTTYLYGADTEFAHIDGGPDDPGYFTACKEAYVCFTESDSTLTFYYDDQWLYRDEMTDGMTFGMNTGSESPEWVNGEVYWMANHVVFDPSFADARPTSTHGWFSDFVQSIEGLEYLNTSEVTDMSNMFVFVGLDNIDVSHFNTSKVTNMTAMFAFMSLTSLDLSNFNTENVTSMYGMFYGCQNLTTINVGSGWSTAAVTSSEDMFKYCESLVGGQGTTYDENHLDKAYAHIDGGPSNPGYLSSYSKEAYACFTEPNQTLTFYYDALRSSRTGTTYDLNTGHNTPGWYDVRNSVTHVVINPSFANARPTTTDYWFYFMEELQDISGLNYLNTSLVTDMAYMFYYCSKLKGIDVSHFITDNVTNMYGLFGYCTSMDSLDVSHFNTAKVTDMGRMFCDCGVLTSLDVTHFNTENVTNMYQMFSSCSGLTSLDVTHFNTSKVTSMASMFSACFGLTTLDLSSFNTTKVTTTRYMFNGCLNMTTIYVGSKWNMDAVTVSDSMFRLCSNLVGGKGTTYDSNHTDKAYAHIDGGTANPGYFTAGRLKGDLNADGQVDVSDVTLLTSCVLNSVPVDLAVADMNDDGSVDVSDVTALIQFVLDN